MLCDSRLQVVRNEVFGNATIELDGVHYSFDKVWQGLVRKNLNKYSAADTHSRCEHAHGLVFTRFCVCQQSRFVPYTQSM